MKMRLVSLGKKIVSLFILMGVDAVSICIAFIVAYELRIGVLSHFFSTVPWELRYYLNFYYLIGTWLIVFWYHGLYKEHFHFIDESREIVVGGIIATVLNLGLLALLKKSGDFSRSLLVLSSLTAIVVLLIVRYLVKYLLVKLRLWTKNFVVVGVNEQSVRLVEALKRKKTMGYIPVGFISVGGEEENFSKDVKVIGGIDKLQYVHESMLVDDAFVVLPNYSKENFVHILEELESHIQNVYIVPDIFGIQTMNAVSEYVDDILLIKIRNNLLNPFNEVVKRVFDVVLSLIGLVLVTPIMLIIAVLIKIDSEGPVFFVQERFGKNLEKFKIIKFRTMVKNADEVLKKLLAENPDMKREFEETVKLKNDPRITRIGRFLRKTSMDELPQLINVLKGDMSLVGPRPLTDVDVGKYGDNVKIVAKVRPGMTGLWQVSGRNDIDYSVRINFDIFYVKNWSLWLDIVILFRTIPAVLKTEGAY